MSDNSERLEEQRHRLTEAMRRDVEVFNKIIDPSPIHWAVKGDGGWMGESGQWGDPEDAKVFGSQDDALEYAVELGAWVERLPPKTILRGEKKRTWRIPDPWYARLWRGLQSLWGRA